MGKFRPRGSAGRRLVGHAVKRGIKAAKRQQGTNYSNNTHTNATDDEASCSVIIVTFILFIIIIAVIAWITN